MDRDPQLPAELAAYLNHDVATAGRVATEMAARQAELAAHRFRAELATRDENRSRQTRIGRLVFGRWKPRRVKQALRVVQSAADIAATIRGG